MKFQQSIDKKITIFPAKGGMVFFMFHLVQFSQFNLAQFNLAQFNSKIILYHTALPWSEADLP